jgi:hypothetical protein
MEVVHIGEGVMAITEVVYSSEVVDIVACSVVEFDR